MITTASDTDVARQQPRCGCCGHARPASRMTQLTDTPGVYICRSCALWAARRSARLPIVRLNPLRLARRLRRRGPDADAFLTAIPILPSADLEVTAAYYESVGMRVAERDGGYLRLHSGAVELHFSTGEAARTPGEAFVHVPDAARLWKRLRSAEVARLGSLQDQPWGVREFVLLDPDGNRIRVGSPVRDQVE